MKKRKNTRSPLRFAVAGLGHIAQTAVLPAFAHARSYAKLTTFISEDKTKLDKLGKMYGVEEHFDYEDYDESLNSGLFDAIYIALPNKLHLNYALRALEQGIHVLCEKPLALTESDCRRLIRAADRSGAKLMTAYRLHFDPANLSAIQIAKTKLGELRYFTSSFSYQMRDRSNIRLRGSEGGDPLWDLGVYCVNAARYLFRAEPIAVSAMGSSSSDPRFSEVTEMVTAQIRFPGDRFASFTVSFGAASMSVYDLVGAKGSLRLEEAYEYAYARELSWKVGEKEGKRRFPKTDQFAPELIYFAKCVRENHRIEPSGLEGLADVRIIRALESSLAQGRVIHLETTPQSLVRRTRPSLSQCIVKPALNRPPEPVHASAPGG
jgi:glucose-fructose oxidoreductase